MNNNVIFDLDGTLFDSMGFWEGVGREFLKRYGIERFPDDFNRKVMAMSVAQSSEYFKEYFNVDESPEYIADSMKEIVADKYRYKAEFKPHVRETLEELAGRNVRMCIATATYRDLVEEALDRLHARHYFDFILSCNDIGLGKDNPFIFNEAMRRMGGNLENTVVVEDALHAITTAKKAGFKVLAVYDSRHDIHRAEIVALADKQVTYMDADTILSL